ncbi:MAG: flagellar biosynthesis protein FlhF [Pseudomonadales bacterium RIFCSPLOWO2_12_60_38]|jgi:flagellar biosynthesis protein FlhF|uniref:Flagellar biosynthesis protein FlhF n=5 Tax=Pseudomonas TaxID=286 RepID=A0A5M8GAT7_9PSED|nr:MULTISPECIES: flagellar biosynthesis protein FlhF [Pseudomonas]ETK42020.1 flagellar biosynthesis regulator FlhF [Pseudomonas fluorescens FH5]MDN5399551.1 flagellar biosynthesis protein FlhF [Pseudomonas sp.]MDN5428268.1 flagellar biosynthesis protein FlhF [Pseudomonadales bacterium]OHC34102.1 MAG: flagellar biosynthesis protein FlhF [Pseudomonadales bacterium RIFCSPLOWO2_12_60_38]OHC36573.1 MAG: flagellar biosynthesis protein FlhF [Pseudomonadales bacterium RIFCSPLOWO2_12_FULL_59_450]PMZ68
MQVKRFFAADMRQAMKLVRDELGADAAIIGNRRIAGGVELTAALDYTPQALAPRVPNMELEDELRKTASRIVSAQAELSMRGDSDASTNRQLFAGLPLTAAEPLVEPTFVEPPRPAAPAPAAAVDQRVIDSMRFELNGLRELLEVQLGSLAWTQLQGSKPQQANLWRRLQRIGLSGPLSRDLLALTAEVEEPRQAWRMLLAHLARMIATPEIEPLEEGGVIAMVGPAGMGKTTTLAKLAARYVLKYGAQNIALVSMDSYRIGAQEQLKTLGRILNVPVTHVDPGQSLANALEPLLRKRVVLIDTAGLQASDPALRMQLESLAGRGIKSKNYLVLATTSQKQVLTAAYHSYKRCGLAGCILTKLDETASLGEVLSLAISHELPVAYLTDGPRIPDDLHLPRRHQLVSRAVSVQMQDEPSEEAMADMFADLYHHPAKRVG